MSSWTIIIQHVLTLSTVPAQRVHDGTRSQAVAKIADCTALQHLLGSHDVIGHVTIW